MSVVGLAPGTQAKGKRVGCEATKLLGFFPLVCLFLLLLRDLQVPLLAGSSRKPATLAHPLPELLCFFIVFCWVTLCWLSQVMATEVVQKQNIF